MKRALWLIGAALLGLYVLGLVAGSPAPQESRAETLASRCAAEFPADADAQTECFTRNAARDMADDRQRRTERAGR